MIYYHICPEEVAEIISKEGLRCNDEGEIYVYDEINHTDDLNGNQLMLENYAIIEIDSKGITFPLNKDNVADYGSFHQFTIEQELIEPQFLKIKKKGIFDTLDFALKDNIRINSFVNKEFASLSLNDQYAYLYEHYKTMNPEFAKYIKKRKEKIYYKSLNC